MSRKLWTRNELIDLIKICGESIEKNADIILGDERYFTDLTVSFKICRIREEEPTININRNFIPEGIVEKEVK